MLILNAKLELVPFLECKMVIEVEIDVGKILGVVPTPGGSEAGSALLMLFVAPAAGGVVAARVLAAAESDGGSVGKLFEAGEIVDVGTITLFELLETARMVVGVRVEPIEGGLHSLFSSGSPGS